MIAPTGLSQDADANRLNLRLMTALRASHGPVRQGDIFQQAMALHVAQDQPVTAATLYNLIGDPAALYSVLAQGDANVPVIHLTRQNGAWVLQWTGNLASYQLEWRAALDDAAGWQSLGDPVNGTNAVVPLNQPTGFLRLRSSQ